MSDGVGDFWFACLHIRCSSRLAQDRVRGFMRVGGAILYIVYGRIIRAEMKLVTQVLG
jgi:hypothetical protein